MSARNAMGLAQIAGLALTLGATGAAYAAEPARAASQTAPAAKRPPEKMASSKVTAAALAADDELLEFLGGADGELDGDGDWLDFLASADLRKLAGAKK